MFAMSQFFILRADGHCYLYIDDVSYDNTAYFVGRIT